MKITAISDTHDQHEQINISPTELLIHAGDATNRGAEKLFQFLYWFAQQPAQYKVFVPGNHDAKAFKKNLVQIQTICNQIGIKLLMDQLLYLEHYNLRIYGAHFFGNYKEPKEYKLLPCELLITHEPSYGIRDYSLKEQKDRDQNIGSKSLDSAIQLVKPKVHVFGHCHEQYGSNQELVPKRFNVSMMDRFSSTIVNIPTVFEM